MNGTRNQFFSRARLAINQHCRIRRRYGPHSFENSAQRSTISDDLRKIHFRADFVFQIELFLRELLFEFPNLAVGKCILDRECKLVCNLAEETDISLTKGIVSEPAENQDANSAIPADQRQTADRLQAFPHRDLSDWGIEPAGEGALERQRFHGSKCSARGRSLDRISQLFVDEPFAFRKIERVKSQLLVFRIWERQAG